MTTSSLRELSSLLWRERDTLDLLLVRLGHPECDAECDGLLRSISSLELHRAVTAREAAAELSIGGEPSLRELIDRMPGDWSIVLAEHRAALLDLATQVCRRVEAVGPAPEPKGDIIVLTGRRRGIQRSLLEFLA